MLGKLFRPTGYKLGLLLTLVFGLVKLNVLVLSGAHAFVFLDNIENALLDLKFLIRGGPGTPEERQAFQEDAHVVIVAIDEKSVRHLGERVERLLTLTEERCREKIAALEEAAKR